MNFDFYVAHDIFVLAHVIIFIVFMFIHELFTLLIVFLLLLTALLPPFFTVLLPPFLTVLPSLQFFLIKRLAVHLFRDFLKNLECLLLIQRLIVVGAENVGELLR